MHKLINVLKKQYGINCINITEQMGGWSALAYKATDGVKDYFLKVIVKPIKILHAILMFCNFIRLDGNWKISGNFLNSFYLIIRIQKAA